MLSLTLLGSALSVPPAFQGAKASVTGQARVPAPLQSQEAGLQTRRVGLASWYGGGEPLNSHVAMGHRFDPDALEAAMWNVPFGTMVRVTSLENGRSVVVRITDRGPARRFRRRVIDLTRRAFAELAPLRQGLVPVTVDQLS